MITYYLDTPGGSVSAMLRFGDFLRMMRTRYPFITFRSVIHGTVASAGTYMAIVADERLMTKNSSTMIHELKSMNFGYYTHMGSYIKHLKRLHRRMIRTYSKKSGLPKSDIAQLLQNETWYNAKKYLKAGFIDKII